jgi:hypothetical protein
MAYDNDVVSCEMNKSLWTLHFIHQLPLFTSLDRSMPGLIKNIKWMFFLLQAVQEASFRRMSPILDDCGHAAYTKS